MERHARIRLSYDLYKAIRAKQRILSRDGCRDAMLFLHPETSRWIRAQLKPVAPQAFMKGRVRINLSSASRTTHQWEYWDVPVRETVTVPRDCIQVGRKSGKPALLEIFLPDVLNSTPVQGSSVELRVCP